MNIRYRKIGKYAGAVIYGDGILGAPEGDDAEFHTRRAFWLTGIVETGNRLGSVMMADGTGFTIGIDQHIAVYPQELADEDFNAADDQGSAFELLAEIERFRSEGISSRSGDLVQPLWEAFKACGWYVSQDGHLRWLENGRARVKNQGIDHVAGDFVHGALIRDEVTPKGGNVRKNSSAWDECQRWATLLHNLTSDPRTFNAQIAFGLHHLKERIKNRKLKADRKRYSFQNLVYGADVVDIRTLKSSELSPAFDLALCVFHSYTVNAPSVAFKLINDVVNEMGFVGGLHEGKKQQDVFARKLLEAIRTKKYGRWGNRWQRTREHAINIGWWSRSLFFGDDPVMGE